MWDQQPSPTPWSHRRGQAAEAGAAAGLSGATPESGAPSPLSSPVTTLGLGVPGSYGGSQASASTTSLGSLGTPASLSPRDEAIPNSSLSGTAAALPPTVPMCPRDHYRTRRREEASTAVVAAIGQRDVGKGKQNQAAPRGLRLDHSLRILCVDDNALNLRVMKHLLTKKMAHLIDLDSLTTAGSGPEALTYLCRREYDMVLLDISMPGMSGLEVCRRLRGGEGSGEAWTEGTGLEGGDTGGERVKSVNRGIDVCAVTTDLADWQVDMYRRAGMNGVVGKPLKEQDIAYALQLAMLTSFPLSFPSPAFSVASTASSASASSSSSAFFAQGPGPSSDLSSLSLVNPGNAKYPFYFRRHGQEQPPPIPQLPISPDYASSAATSASGVFALRRGSACASLMDRAGSPCSDVMPVEGCGGKAGEGSMQAAKGGPVRKDRDEARASPRVVELQVAMGPERTDSNETAVPSGMSSSTTTLDSFYTAECGAFAFDEPEKLTEPTSGPTPLLQEPKAEQVARPDLGERHESYESHTSTESSVPSSLGALAPTVAASLSASLAGYACPDAAEAQCGPSTAPGLVGGGSVDAFDLSEGRVGLSYGKISAILTEPDPFEANFATALKTPDTGLDEVNLGDDPLDDEPSSEEESTPPHAAVYPLYVPAGRLDDAWANLRDPSPSGPSEDADSSADQRDGDNISNYTRHLLARRSHPMLVSWRAHSYDAAAAEERGAAPVRQARSLCGSPPRLTYQLLQLAKEQSVLKEGPLLSEVLRDLDAEDERSGRDSRVRESASAIARGR